MSELLPWITYEEFAELHRISVSTVKNLIRNGDLVSVKVVGGSPRIAPEEVERFRKARAVSS